MGLWRDMPLCDGEGDVRPTSARGLRALAEYRATGTMAGHWPCTHAELDAAGDDDLAELGYDPEHYDWTGFDAALDAAGLDRRGRARVAS